MMQNTFSHSPLTLPQELSVFPLSGVLLLPNGRLPLNIFEPRYLNLVLDSFREERLIGMVQTTQMARDPVPDDAELFKIGCLGKIVSFAEIPDGRFHITLEGICRYTIQRDLGIRNGYRRVSPDFSLFEGDMKNPVHKIDRDGFKELLNQYFKMKHIRVDWSMLDKTEDHLLVANLGMICPFNAQEKQALLQARDQIHMAEVMMSLLEMAVQEVAGAVKDSSPIMH